MVEIFAHGITALLCEDTEDVYIIAGKDWENNPFKMYLTRDEAKSLLVQLGYQVYERNDYYD